MQHRVVHPDTRNLTPEHSACKTGICKRLSLIDGPAVIERILRHLGLWQQGIRVASGPAPPADWVIEPCFDDATPDYDTDQDLIFRERIIHRGRPGLSLSGHRKANQRLWAGRGIPLPSKSRWFGV